MMVCFRALLLITCGEQKAPDITVTKSVRFDELENTYFGCILQHYPPPSVRSLNGNSALGGGCAARESRQAARGRGKHYQSGSSNWLQHKTQLRSACYENMALQASVKFRWSQRRDDGRKRRGRKVERKWSGSGADVECVVHGRSTTKLKTPIMRRITKTGTHNLG